MIKILFVCHGNICRSPMAEFYMKDLVVRNGYQGLIHIESAATHTDELGSDIHPGTREQLLKNEINFEKRQARLLRSRDYENFDYFIGMDTFNRSDMLKLFNGDPEEKVSLLMDWTGVEKDVADPWYTHNFEQTFSDIEAGCIAFFEHLKRLHSNRR